MAVGISVAVAAQVVSGAKASPDVAPPAPPIGEQSSRGILRKKKMLLGVTPLKLTSLIFCDLIFPSNIIGKVFLS